MTDGPENSKKGIAAICRANYPAHRKGEVVSDCRVPVYKIMLKIMSRRSFWLVAVVALGILPLANLRGEEESAATGSGTELSTPAGSGGPASSATPLASGSDSGSNVGVGVFSRFPINVSISVHGGYDDNVNTSHFNKQDSWFTTAGLLLNYQGGNSRTKFSISTNFGFIYYTNTDQNPFEPNLNLAANFSHKVSPRLAITASGLFVYQTEPDFQYGLGINRRAGNYFYTDERLAAEYMWAPRFSTVTTYGLTAVRYDQLAIGFFENRAENTVGNQFRFLLLPTTNLVGEYRFQVVSYENFNRDSTTHYLLGGVDHAFGPRLTANFRVGEQIRDYDQFGEQTSPYFESTVNYKLGKDSSAAWSTHYGIEEGDVLTNPTRKTFRTGLTAKRNITARITASLSMFYEHDDYQEQQIVNPAGPATISPSFSEDWFNIDVGLRYAVTRYLGLEAGYNYSDISSDITLRDYSRNRVWAGLNVAF
jgi:hypothetical protein